MLGNWPKGIIEDRYDFFAEGYDEPNSMIEQIFEVKQPTQGSFDQRTTAIMAGKLAQRTAENLSVTFRRPSEGFTAYAAYRDFDDGLELTKNEVEDFPVDKIRDLVQTHISDWGRALRLTEEDYAATLFTKGGFTAGHDNFTNVIPNVISQNTGGLAYDGKPAFNLSNNTRTSKGGGTYYNAISGATLNVTNYGTLHDLVFVTNAYNERDERVNLKSMGKVGLLVPPQLRDDGFRAIESEYLPGTEFNDKNAFYKSAQLIEWDALRGVSSTWFLGVLKQGIRFYRRGKPEIRMFRDESNGAYKATIRARYAFMFWNFRPWGGANVPTS
jgi:hypothetical protein